MKYLPLLFDVYNKACLLVGGGAVAYRKATLLSRAGAKLFVVAPDIDPQLLQLVESGGGTVFIDQYDSRYLDNMHLVIAATNNRPLNAGVAADCTQRGKLVNVVDDPEHCNIIFPAIVDRDPLLIAVSSSGEAPVLARSVRSTLESSVPANLGALAEFIGQRRQRVRQSLGEQHLRLFWEAIVESEVAERVMAGRQAEAEVLFEDLLEVAKADSKKSRGEVYLVGAGPGDPDLLTFKALRLMQRADVVLYDRLVSPAIVDMCRRDAEKVYVGKARSDHAVPQQEINSLLIDYANQGKKVVRLKGGDPFVFGRGGEEIEGLASNGIPFQIVPGISAANGCACYAGIPLTHRDHSQSVRFLTGHLKDGSMDLPWPELVSPAQTVVIYMGLQGLPVICEQLIKHGAPADTDVALVERGTMPDQQTHVGTLETICAIVQKKEVHAPTLIIIGSVVTLQPQLNWLQ